MRTAPVTDDRRSIGLRARDRLRAASPDAARGLGTGIRDFGIAIAFLLLFVVLSVTSDVFATKANLLNLLDQSAPIGIMAAAGTLVFIAGGFDLSVGALLTLAGVLAAKAAGEVSVVPALLVGLAVGLAGGVLNGLLASVGRINAFITTLATSIIFRGVALALTGGSVIAVADPSFTDLGLGSFLGVTYTIWLWVAFALVCAVLLNRTVFGRYVFSCGDNLEAARLSGLRTGLVRASTFALSGFSAGLAGILIASRSASGDTGTGTGIELTVIAAIVIGGTSLLGGEGAIWRSVVGVLILGMINNAFTLLNVSGNYQQIVMGTIILLAVALDMWSRRRSA